MLSCLLRFLCLLCLALLLPACCHGDALPEVSLPPVRIASFNIQVFGVTKMSKPEVVDILLKTLLRYDLVFVMEIRDKSGKAIESLLQQLNSLIPDTERHFRLLLSERLGRTSAKEQYAYLYRQSNFRLLESFQYDDVEDVFERPPFGALFEVTGAEKLHTLGFLGIHVAPRDAKIELEALHGVQETLRQRWDNESLMIVGDFNADCTYLNRYDRVDLRLWRDSSLKWLIDACHETTTVLTSCLYDRILTSGRQLDMAIVPNSADVFYFDKEYQLNRTMAHQVSDHYPVEVQLAGEIVNDQIRQLATSQSFEITQAAANHESALSLCHGLASSVARILSFTVTCLRVENSATSTLHSAVVEKSDAANAGAAVQEMLAAFPGILHSHAATLARQLQLQRLSQASRVSVRLKCEFLESPASCGVKVTAADKERRRG